MIDGGVAAMIFSMENASFLMRGSDVVFARSSLGGFGMKSSSPIVVMVSWRTAETPPLLRGVSFTFSRTVTLNVEFSDLPGKAL